MAAENSQALLADMQKKSREVRENHGSCMGLEARWLDVSDIVPTGS